MVAAWFQKRRMMGLARLMSEVLPYRKHMAAVIGLGLVISAVQPASVKLSQEIVDQLQQGKSRDFLRWVPLALVLIFVVSGLAKYFHNTIRRYVAERIVIHLRAQLFEKFLRLPLAVLDRKRTGELLSGIQNDLAQVAQGLNTLCDILKEPFTFLGLMGVAFYCDPILTLCTLIVAPLVAFLFSHSGAAVKRYSGRNLVQFSDLMSLSQEGLTGARVIKIFRLELPLMAKFRQVHDEYFATAWKSVKVQELATPLVELIGALLMAGILIYGGYRIEQGALTAGQLVAFIIAIGLAQMPIKQLNNAYLKMKVAEAAAERIYEILDTATPRVELGSSLRKASFTESIHYDGVGLDYGESPALRNISFEVKVGECVAFVGRSGGGKSSVVNLLPRLYEISHGRITLDGVDLRSLYIEDLRSLISYVTQDTFLFNDTLWENIRYGNPLASPEEVRRAAEQAHCLDFIEKNPEGFQTRIGDRGVCLSGGERQRVAIARAILKGAPILILDEATSSLDSHSEKIVQQALDELMVGKTTLMVAHRFSTVRRADRIYVLDGGEIRETGNHTELVNRAGAYRELFETQLL